MLYFKSTSEKYFQKTFYKYFAHHFLYLKILKFHIFNLSPFFGSYPRLESHIQTTNKTLLPLLLLPALASEGYFLLFDS